MNTLLAGTLGFLNTVIAVLLIAVGTFIGYNGGMVGGIFISDLHGAVAGFLGGLVTAAILCGFVAVLIDIRYQRRFPPWRLKHSGGQGAD